MIPLRDNIPSRTTPFVNYFLIALNVLVFAYQFTLSAPQEAALFFDFGVRPLEYWNIFHSTEPLLMGVLAPLFTSMFLHGGFFHLGGNMLFLWVFGDNVEDRLGHVAYAFFYLFFGVAASLTHIIFSGASDIPTLGASGAVSGVLGAYLLFYPRAQVRALIPLFVIFLYRELPAIVFLGLWFALQVFQGIGSLGVSSGGGVAWWAHIGGFVAGVLVAIPWKMFGGNREEERVYEYEDDYYDDRRYRSRHE